jgi:hypothetical protein
MYVVFLEDIGNTLWNKVVQARNCSLLRKLNGRRTSWPSTEYYVIRLENVQWQSPDFYSAKTN